MQGIKGVPPIKEGLNPATWMLEVSTPGAEQRTGVDFAEVYKGSEFARYTIPPRDVNNMVFEAGPKAVRRTRV